MTTGEMVQGHSVKTGIRRRVPRDCEGTLTRGGVRVRSAGPIPRWGPRVFTAYTKSGDVSRTTTGTGTFYQPLYLHLIWTDQSYLESRRSGLRPRKDDLKLELLYSNPGDVDRTVVRDLHGPWRSTSSSDLNCVSTLLGSQTLILKITMTDSELGVTKISVQIELEKSLYLVI